jgi:Kinesin motor domain
MYGSQLGTRRLILHAKHAVSCTRQESLGGNAKTTLVVAVADAAEHVDETLQSMQFGSRAMRVRTRAIVNERLVSQVRHVQAGGI